MQKDDSLFSRLKKYGLSYFIKTVTAILSLLITYCSSCDAHDHQSLLKKSPQTRHSYFCSNRMANVSYCIEEFVFNVFTDN